MHPFLLRPPASAWARPSALLPLPVRRVLRYAEAHGRRPDLLRPRSFTEKLNWRISFDRRELLAPTCDKLAMKEHARRRAADLVRIPRTVWAGRDVGGLTGETMPDRWVLKPNHSCMRVLFGRGPIDAADLAARTSGWLQDQYWRKSDEWAYRRARPGLLVEEFIGSSGGDPPADLKVLVFGGVPRLVSVHTARHDRQQIRLYTPDWEPMALDSGYPIGPDRPPPERLTDLLAAAAALASGFDMLRVDLYEHDGDLWFGELTPYPGAGLVRLDPELDALLGSWWTLPTLPWRSMLTTPLRRPRPLRGVPLR